MATSDFDLLGAATVPDFSQSNRCVVLFSFCFNLHSPSDIKCGASFLNLTISISSLVNYTDTLLIFKLEGVSILLLNF